MKQKIKAGIVGGAGYTGGEMLRLLMHHPLVEVACVQSRSNAGQPITAVHPDLTGDTDLEFSSTLEKVDVLFLCLGHGESRKFLEQNSISSDTRIIDLSHDFRLDNIAGDRNFVYGLPELQKEEIQLATSVANPGCFATAIQLALLPLANAGVLHDVTTTGITGSTGAGQKLQDTTHFTWRANNISAYKTLNHQHVGEIRQSLKKLQHTYTGSVHFIPWRGDFTRGIFTSSCLATDRSIDRLLELYSKFYESHPFTIVSHKPIDLKMVVNTNKCVISIEKQDNQVVIHSALDNLLKGASGQAVQNMNLMFGLDERAGLSLKSIAF